MDDQTLRAELERHHGESYGWALSCCGGNPADAEDVLQTVYLKVLKGRATFAGRSSLKTWLLALIRNTAADEWRRRSRQEWMLAQLIEQEPVAREAAPDELAHQAQVCSVLVNALAGLPARQQEVLRLVFYHDLTVAQAAEVMDLSLGSARTHYERGKKSLRRQLEQTNMYHERTRTNQATLC